jgi:benzil reductase ((S)-benzoin forming)
MKKHLYIITGTSRGLGLAMALQLLGPGHFLLCISRSAPESLGAAARAANADFEHWPLDLDHGLQAGAMLTQWLGSRKPGSFASATLINNAGVLPRIAPLSQADPAELSKVLRVGLEAPMQLTAAFLHGTEGWLDAMAAQDAAGLGASHEGTHAFPRRVLNISSGNGRNPMASQSIYSAAKAGLDHFTRCLALEEALKPHGARVCSLAPGVIDTDMQDHLRASDAQGFPDHGRFVELKEKGRLNSPADAAALVLAYLARADFGSNPVADVRDAA